MTVSETISQAKSVEGFDCLRKTNDLIDLSSHIRIEKTTTKATSPFDFAFDDDVT
jgi:hypothetical protein